jgi:2-oxo-3-(phosphooxy)propyl 3-oxoalkanoate synthase
MDSFPVHRAVAFLKTAGEPAFEATIPRTFAHKQAVEEMFLTDIIVDMDRERVLACAQLPRSHALYNEVENGVHDLLLILETARQGMTIYGHIRLEIPEETVFVMNGLRVDIVDPEAMRQGERPGELVIDVPFGKERRDGRGRVRGYTLTGAATIDDRPAVEIKGDALLIPAALYERVRSVRVDESTEIPPPPEPVDPARVGRRSPCNVVVGDAVRSNGDLRCALIADTAHPSFFDHPLDHVPGMLMLETARQAALLYVEELGWSPTETMLDGCEAHFSQYAALSPPASCRVCAVERPDGEEGESPVEHLRAFFSQVGVDIGHVDLRVRPIGSR